MASQTGKIASISTGRETLLIGPATEFGVGQRSLTLANSTSAELALSRFMMRQGARDLIRPHMRRWGLALSPTGSGGPADDVEILVRSVRSGALRIAMVPDVTLAFAGVGDVAVRGPPPTHRFPDDFVGRFTIVLDMAPNYLEGAAKTAFIETVEGVGKSAIIAGLATWIGVHFIPGVDIAALAFDLFFLGRDVIDACDKIANSFKAIRDAKSEVDLEPVAKVVAAALATLIVNGILKRILKLRKPAKGPAAKANAEAARQPRERREARKPKGAEEARTAKSPMRSRPEIFSEIQSTPKGQRANPNKYMSKGELQAHRQKFDQGASRLTLKSNIEKYGPAQADGTAFVMPKGEMDQLLASSGGDKRKLEKALGLPADTLEGNELVRIDIPDPGKLNVRMPSGNEAGANSQWIPGGTLPNGNTEAVLDIGSSPPGLFSISPVKLE